MTQEDKELLLKDLVARLPYGVICNDNRHGSGRVTYVDITLDDIEQNNGKVVVYYFDFDECGELKNCKPYLRPMSSMTEEEENEWNGLIIDPLFEAVGKQHTRIEDLMLRAKSQYNPVDWLNAHHFDYRGLIEKGLAIAVTEDNNPYET